MQNQNVALSYVIENINIASHVVHVANVRFKPTLIKNSNILTVRRLATKKVYGLHHHKDINMRSTIRKGCPSWICTDLLIKQTTGGDGGCHPDPHV